MEIRMHSASKQTDMHAVTSYQSEKKKSSGICIFRYFRRCLCFCYRKCARE